MFLGAAVGAFLVFSFGVIAVLAARVGVARGERHRELQIPLFVGNMDVGGVNTSVVPAGMVLLPAQVRRRRVDAARSRGRERGLTVFARIDFAADAAAVGMHLRRRDCWCSQSARRHSAAGSGATAGSTCR